MGRHLRRECLPECPADLDPDTPLVALLDRYHRHVLQLAAARADPSRPSSVEIGERALAALTIAHVVIQDLFEERWPIVHDALVHGVSPEQVGVATGGLAPDELATGLTAWAGRRRAAGVLTGAEHVAVLALADSWSRRGSDQAV